jgi:hypothetical protein
MSDEPSLPADSTDDSSANMVRSSSVSSACELSTS